MNTRNIATRGVGGLRKRAMRARAARVVKERVQRFHEVLRGGLGSSSADIP